MTSISEKVAEVRPKDFGLELAKGVVRAGMAMELSPEATGKVFAELTDTTARGLSYGFTHFSDPEALKNLGRILGGERGKCK